MRVARLLLSTLLPIAALASENPLAPLSPAEIETSVSILKSASGLPEKSVIASLLLEEPEKRALHPARIARATVIDHQRRRSTDYLVDLSAQKLLSILPITNGQPLETGSEFLTAIDTVRNSPEWQSAIRRRGITNYQDIYVSVWAGGHQLYKNISAHRFGRAISYYRGVQTNEQGPPIEGLEAIVDLDEQRVLQVIDTGLRPTPPDSTDFFNPAVRGTNRAPLKPLLTTQPEGPSFTAQNYTVTWDHWKFSWSFNQREGLVLHQIRYLDQDRERSILYRASISEMLVPYGSPSELWFWRNAVDEGEYGLGNCAYPLLPGQTAPPHATLFDIPLCAEDGSVNLATNRVGLYERVNESLWSHSNLEGLTIGRRSRELVIFFIATVGNYDYRFAWTFRQDGVIDFEVGMTGILLMAGSATESCQACAPEARPGTLHGEGDERFGTLVARNTIAQFHQHFVNLRLDFDVDGVENSIKELNALPVRGRRQNPHENAWEVLSTTFGKEREATRDLSPSTARHWAIFNPNARNPLGHFTSYLLEPAGNALPFLAPSTRTRRLLGFINHPLHVTRLHSGELYAGGRYPNQIHSPDNVETWTRNNEPIHKQDLVVWYTLGMTHIPRPEEYPVMPTSRTGFRLVPKGFFPRNPALDLPEE